MAVLRQSVIIDPPTVIKFKGPYNVPTTSYLKLTNPTESKVYFKIKTKAKKKYSVRPNRGLLFPGANVEVSIILQPPATDLTALHKHKFMVQTAIAADSALEPEEVWDSIRSEDIVNTKLYCVFEAPTPPIEPIKTISSEEKDRLQKEMETLLEEVEVLRRSQGEGLAPSRAKNHSFEPPAQNHLPTYLGAILCAVIGIIIGKFIL